MYKSYGPNGQWGPVFAGAITGAVAAVPAEATRFDCPKSAGSITPPKGCLPLAKASAIVTDETNTGAISFSSGLKEAGRAALLFAASAEASECCRPTFAFSASFAFGRRFFDFFGSANMMLSFGSFVSGRSSMPKRRQFDKGFLAFACLKRSAAWQRI